MTQKPSDRESKAANAPARLSPSEIAPREAENALQQHDWMLGVIRKEIESHKRFRLRPSVMLDLNRLAVKDIEILAGTYRNVPITMTKSEHDPPDKEEVPAYVEEMCEYVNDNWHKSAVHLAAYLLWRINWIHPFTDGNGRTARALSYMVLSIRLGFALPGVDTIPEHLADNKQPYYQGLEQADEFDKQGIVKLDVLEALLGECLTKQLQGVLSAATEDEASLPLVVERLQIRNFRNISKLDLVFEPSERLQGHWTCFAGINGSGKTSVLQALALVLMGARHANDLGSGRLQRMRRLEHGERQDVIISASVREDSGLIELELRISAEGVTDSKRDEAFSERQAQRVIVSYGATRNLADDPVSGYEHLGATVRHHITLFDSQAEIAQADILLSQSEESVPTFVALLTDLVKQLFDQDLVLVRNSGRLKFEMNGEGLEAVDLPDGFRSSLAWIADLCAVAVEKCPNAVRSGSAEKIEGIVLIDEIDLHLHPRLQRSLVPALRKALPNVQWLVTTHSPLIISSFCRQELVALDAAEPDGFRVLDREVLGFSPDEVYEWLMDTRTSSVVIDQTEDLGDESREELTKLLDMSPTIDANEAEKRQTRRVELLANLKNK